MRPKAISDLIAETVQELTLELRKNAKQVSEDLNEIKNIAAVSLNNNEDIGNLIYEIYDKIGLEGFISVKLGNETKTTYETKDGFMIQQGRMDETFVNNSNNESELYDSAVLIFGQAVNDQDLTNYCIDTMKEVKDLYTKYGEKSKFKSVTIIAPGFGRDFVSNIRTLIAGLRKYNAHIYFNLIQYSLATEYDREMLYDVSLMCGASIINESETGDKKLKTTLEKSTSGKREDATLGDYVGYAGRIISGKKVTTFYNCDVNETLLDVERGRIKEELKVIENDPGEMVRTYELKKRLAVINKKLVTISVGGIDETARLNDKELIDDAVSACRCAIESGYALGCNIPIIKAAQALYENEIHEFVQNSRKIEMLLIFKKTFISVYEDILSNRYGCKFEELSDIELEDVGNVITISIEENKVYNLITKEFTDTEIISPAETDIKILEHISSIISLIITSDQMICRNSTEEIELEDLIFE